MPIKAQHPRTPRFARIDQWLNASICDLNLKSKALSCSVLDFKDPVIGQQISRPNETTLLVNAADSLTSCVRLPSGSANCQRAIRSNQSPTLVHGGNLSRNGVRYVLPNAKTGRYLNCEFSSDSALNRCTNTRGVVESAPNATHTYVRLGKSSAAIVSLHKDGGITVCPTGALTSRSARNIDCYRRTTDSALRGDGNRLQVISPASLSLRESVLVTQPSGVSDGAKEAMAWIQQRLKEMQVAISAAGSGGEALIGAQIISPDQEEDPLKQSMYDYLTLENFFWGWQTQGFWEIWSRDYLWKGDPEALKLCLDTCSQDEKEGLAVCGVATAIAWTLGPTVGGGVGAVCVGAMSFNYLRCVAECRKKHG